MAKKTKKVTLRSTTEAAEESAREETIFQLKAAIKMVHAGHDDSACTTIVEALMCLGSVRGCGNLAVDIEESGLIPAPAH